MSESEGQHTHAHGDKGDKGEKGDAGSSPTGDLLASVRELVKEVDTLSRRLREDYPTKTEVRHEGRMRVLKSLVFGICIVVAANLVTIQTISYCFLAPAGETRPRCNLIPGYKSTQEVGNERLARFELLLNQIETNQNAIMDLQERVGELERQGQ